VVGMKNKIIIVFALIALNILLSGTALAKTITVDDSGGCDFTSIQDAINSNIDNMGSPIDSNVTITVYPGVYQESLKLLFPMNLKAYSSNPADTVIESGDYAITFSDRFSGGFLISGFTIKGAKAGIYSSRESFLASLTIVNNTITGGNFGIYLYTDIPIIKNNKFENNSCGVYVGECYPCKITENDFINNSGFGLVVSDCAADVNNNFFTKNGLAILSSIQGAQIISNEIRDNKAGISIGVTSGTLIVSNIIERNIDYGIDYSLAKAQIYNNYFNNEINTIGESYSFNLSIGASAGPNIVGGSYIGGNFWGKPDCTGFSQTCPDVDLDGFCDEAYVINGRNFNATDYLPLKEIASPPELIFPIANFRTNATSGYVPLDVQFTDLSENTTQWSWDFGDGLNSIEQNPVHLYTVPGTYTVNLTVSNTNSTDSKTATINILKATPTITWSNPADIISETALDSTQLNAVASVPGTFVYTPAVGTVLAVGTHTLHVDFTPTDAANYTTVSKDVTINVLEKPAIPIANFSASPTTGKAQLTVAFADKSTG
jgi:parallel beta-helix repeat protein